jgi:opacity protein-like surface antigen
MRKTLLSLTLAVLLPASALAQDGGPYGAKGFSLGLALNGTAIKSEEAFDSSSETGGGLSLLAAFGFTQKFSLFLEGTGAALDIEDESWTLAHGDLGLRYHFAGSGRKFVPFIDGAFTSILAGADEAEFDEGSSETVDVEITGTGFSIGGGFDYFLSPRMAFVTAFRYTDAEFTKVKVDNVSVEGFDFDVSTTRLNVGLRWFFGSR